MEIWSLRVLMRGRLVRRLQNLCWAAPILKAKLGSRVIMRSGFLWGVRKMFSGLHPIWVEILGERAIICTGFVRGLPNFCGIASWRQIFVLKGYCEICRWCQPGHEGIVGRRIFEQRSRRLWSLLQISSYHFLFTKVHLYSLGSCCTEIHYILLWNTYPVSLENLTRGCLFTISQPKTFM